MKIVGFLIAIVGHCLSILVLVITNTDSGPSQNMIIFLAVSGERSEEIFPSVGFLPDLKGRGIRLDHL